MKICKYIIMKASELPFYEDIHGLIEKHPEYLEGIIAGVVHIGFNPGEREKRKPKATLNPAVSGIRRGR
jgi:hypothetical protein